MSRSYTVTQRSGGGRTQVEIKTDDAQAALDHFRRGLFDAGHSTDQVQRRMNVWTRTLMGGGLGYEVINTGLDGSISINITP